MGEQGSVQDPIEAVGADFAAALIDHFFQNPDQTSADENGYGDVENSVIVYFDNWVASCETWDDVLSLVFQDVEIGVRVLGDIHQTFANCVAGDYDYDYDET